MFSLSSLPMSDSSSSSSDSNAPKSTVGTNPRATVRATAVSKAVSTETPMPPPKTSSSSSKARSFINNLSSILASVPANLFTSPNPCYSLLHDPAVSSQISTLLRQPDSGSGDNNICRWLYDTFHSSEPELQLVVVRYVPLIAGIYLSRISRRKFMAGFEAILLALYSQETTARRGEPVTVHVPDLSRASIYHESKRSSNKNKSTDLNVGVLSSTLEAHGAMRSTKRATIVGVALEMYCGKISEMPAISKMEFCEFCEIWAGQEERKKAKDGEKDRIPLPWEFMQPCLRILGHCLMGVQPSDELFDAASSAIKCLYLRSLQHIDAKAILATTSLLRLQKDALDPVKNVDYTEISVHNVIAM